MRKFLPLLLAPLLLVTPAIAGNAPAAPVTASKEVVDLTPWLYKGSDIPPDPSWTFGQLPNGLRYAVQRNIVPGKQVSIRVRIDAGSLHENDDELGYAHLIEHLSFRGSTHVPDGEAKRIWQRFGVTFGSDSNAQTTPTQTVYKLDLPNATSASLDESVKILSGMVRDPNISESALNAERSIVQAELRENSDPISAYQDALRETFFKGQRLAKRSVIGTLTSLEASTAEGVEAFHTRWYRPENTVVVMVGDAEPLDLVKLVQRHFTDWKAQGKPAPAPDFGKPGLGEVTRLMHEPTLPARISIGYIQPWEQVGDTVANNEQLMIDGLAVQIVDRRLRELARAGGNYLTAEINHDGFMRSGNITQISITPAQGRWEEAVRDIRSVIADALAAPPSQYDIDREYARMIDVMRTRVASAAFEEATNQADALVRAVDIRETVATPEFALQVSENVKSKLTPATILEATKRQFSDEASRLLLASPQPITDATKRMVTALNAPVEPNSGARLVATNASFDALPTIGVSGTIVKSETNPDLQLTKLELSNGVRALLFPNKDEADQIRMVVRFGKGVQAVAPSGTDFLWAGPLIFAENGVGNLKQAQIEEMMLGRRIDLAFDIDNDAFEYTSTTRAADLTDQLKLIAAKLEHPGWDPAPVARARELARSGYDSYEMSPMAVIERDLTWLLASKDVRFKSPDLEDIAKLNPEAFRKFWEPLLMQGPVEVSIFGDFDKDAAKAALQSTLGAIKPRVIDAANPAALARKFPVATDAPLRLTHKGQQDQGAAVLAWPTGGGIDRVGEGRALDILAAIFSDRLFEKFRTEQAASYGADAMNNWPVEFESGGFLITYSQVRAAEVERFFSFAEDIAKDLANNPVSEDELKRAVLPVTQMIYRNMTGNTHWLTHLKGATWQPKKFTALSTLLSDYEHTTPASLQVLAKRYLVPGKAWKLVVAPASAAPSAATEATR